MIDYNEYECGCALKSPGGVPDKCPVHGVSMRTAPLQATLARHTPEALPELDPVYFAGMSEEQKLQAVCQMIDLLTREQKDAILQQLAKEQPQGETTVNVVNPDEKTVRLDFGRTLAWFVMPKAHALQLGALLMQHAGATLQQVPNPTRSDGQ